MSLDGTVGIIAGLSLLNTHTDRRHPTAGAAGNRLRNTGLALHTTTTWQAPLSLAPGFVASPPILLSTAVDDRDDNLLTEVCVWSARRQTTLHLLHQHRLFASASAAAVVVASLRFD